MRTVRTDLASREAKLQRFHIIPEAEAIIRRKGVFKQVKVFERKDEAGDRALYIGAGGGFVRLYINHATGIPDVSWDDIEIPGIDRSRIINDKTGKLIIK